MPSVGVWGFRGVQYNKEVSFFTLVIGIMFPMEFFLLEGGEKAGLTHKTSLFQAAFSFGSFPDYDTAGE